MAQRLVDEYLQGVLAGRKRSASFIDKRYDRLWTRIDSNIMSGGKRIRPYLTMIGYGAVDERIVPIAAAQELIHSAMLMHDDVIDKDDVRRGQKNVNGQYKDEYADYLASSQAEHYANTMGILAGDTLISEAYWAVYQADFSDRVKRQVAAQLHESVFEVIGGELLDVEAVFVKDHEFDPLRIYRYKTSSYSFIGPLLSGAYCAGVDERTCGLLRDFATAAGIAYQIQDDMLGVFGDETETGKSTLADLQENKRTLLVKFHEQTMDDDMKGNFRAFGRPEAAAGVLERIKSDMQRSGARAKTAKEADAYFAEARSYLGKLEPGWRRDCLDALLKGLAGRRR